MTSRARWILLLASGSVATACGGAAHEEPTSGETSSGDDRAGDLAGEGGDGTRGSAHTIDPSARAPGACPATFVSTPSPSCTDADFPVGCSYPEGTCQCAEPSWCGGAAPPPMPPIWRCFATAPRCPAAGTPCTGAGDCRLDDCGFHRVVCRNGVWESQTSPPPP